MSKGRWSMPVSLAESIYWRRTLERETDRTGMLWSELTPEQQAGVRDRAMSRATAIAKRYQRMKARAKRQAKRERLAYIAALEAAGRAGGQLPRAKAPGLVPG